MKIKCYLIIKYLVLDLYTQYTLTNIIIQFLHKIQILKVFNNK